MSESKPPLPKPMPVTSMPDRADKEWSDMNMKKGISSSREVKLGGKSSK